MPVHYIGAPALLVVAVDGDFTVSEFHRVVAEAATDPEVPYAALVLLDLTGASSLAQKSDEDLLACASAFAGASLPFERVAILVAGDPVDDLMRMGTAFMGQAGIRAAPFRSRVDALSWLSDTT